MVFKDIPHTSKVECLQISTFFELEPTSEAGDLWTPDLGPLSRHSVFFLKGTILSPQKGPCGMQWMQKQKQGRLPWKHFYYSNSPSDFLHQEGF